MKLNETMQEESKFTKFMVEGNVVEHFCPSHFVLTCTLPPMIFFNKKKSSGDSYLKILDFSQFFIEDALMKKIQKFGFTPAQSTFRTPSTKIFYIFLL